MQIYINVQQVHMYKCMFLKKESQNIKHSYISGDVSVSDGFRSDITIK